MNQLRWNELQARAYQWLADEIGMDLEDCHFRYFDVGLCEAVAVLARRKLKSLKKSRRRRRKRLFNTAKGQRRTA